MSMSERTPLLPSLSQHPPLLPTRPYDPTSESEHSRSISSKHSQQSRESSRPFEPLSHNHEPPRDVAVRRDSSVRRDSDMAVRRAPSPVGSQSSAADSLLSQDPESSPRGGGEPMKPVSRGQRVKTYFLEDVVSNRYCTGQLMVYTFATGIIDLTTLVSYGCFATKQTGNTVFLAMRLADHPYVDEEQVNIYFSFGFFLAGLIAFAHVITYLTSKRPLMRLALFLSAMLQVAFTWMATALVIWVSDRDDWPISAVIMALLAFQAGGQINISAQLGQSELNTTMITGVLLQVCRDPEILKWENPARNRRLSYWFMFMLGCFSGSGLSKYLAPRWGYVVYAVFKTVLAMSFLLNEGRQPEFEGEMERQIRGKTRGFWSTLKDTLCFGEV